MNQPAVAVFTSFSFSAHLSYSPIAPINYKQTINCSCIQLLLILSSPVVLIFHTWSEQTAWKRTITSYSCIQILLLLSSPVVLDPGQQRHKPVAVALAVSIQKDNDIPSGKLSSTIACLDQSQSLGVAVELDLPVPLLDVLLQGTLQEVWPQQARHSHSQYKTQS